MFFLRFCFLELDQETFEIHSGVADVLSLHLTQKVYCSRNTMESVREVPFG